MKFFIIFVFFLYSCETLIYSDYKIIDFNKERSLNFYSVKRGDNLYSISKKLNISIGSLIEINKILPPYKIFPRQQIFYPSESFHKVKKGDTLYSISRLYRTDVYSISKLNNLKNINSINEGQKLRIFKPVSNSSHSNNVQVKKKKKNSPQATKKTFIASEQSIVKSSKLRSGFIWPVKGKIISNYGKSSGGFFNDGINIDSKMNANVKASSDGTVIYSGNEIPGYGNLVLIKHSKNWITAYAHLSKVFIVRGVKVKKGESIGLVGKTGNVSKPQLHFEIRRGKEAVNPIKYLS